MAPPRVHQEHGQFLIDTYRFEVLNKYSGERSRALDTLLVCVNA